MRWVRAGLILTGAIAVLAGLALLKWGEAPESALGWVLLPLGGAALLLVEALGELFVEGGLRQGKRVLTVQGFVVLALVVALVATALVVAWTVLA
jgi:hypothetical protein